MTQPLTIILFLTLASIRPWLRNVHGVGVMDLKRNANAPNWAHRSTAALKEVLDNSTESEPGKSPLDQGAAITPPAGIKPRPSIPLHCGAP